MSDPDDHPAFPRHLHRSTLYLDEEIARTDRLVIKTRDACEQAYAELARLQRAGAALGTPEGKRLDDLIIAVEAFEMTISGYSG
ncbi:hypothetical protein CLV79_10919 [Limimaricola soesokkakensis]|uniref:Uncharacterized protein n=1 Tax=Limimaricola soesokkakensis TaxID=1343159 RepID=A0A1X6ZSB9_9RHOB|nr:hypothetical protein [Limimaricola soesokkakensis]PSK84047.1 hypothetical protein CLV79_10919 [Limimaricola soesokkakensis]SLN59845.1 hypothetical protein LOS8367_02879 [Limimaricola soesokkakensis]